MGDFGFGQLTKTLPVGTKSFQGSLDLPQQNELMVKIFAGIDVVNQMVIWEFQTIDKTSGEAPTDPRIGFLPPNNGTTGQGFVTFSMKPKPDVNHLSTIHTNASIYFDNNVPIDTPNIINTVDDQSPNMTASIINGTKSADSVTLSLKATDLGSGVNHVDIFQWEEGQFVMLKAGITENIFVLSLEPGDVFSLVTIAVDEVGNRMEINKVDPASFINISSPAVDECTDGWFGVNCSENCSCKVNSTIQCNRQNGSCTCKPGWEGKDCDSDVDECSNMTICDNHQYTTCQNKEWGYDCVCMVGYKLEQNRCVECTEGRYGMNCKDTCLCEVNNTVQCNRQNGSCTCKPGWEGKDCDSDVDECSNKTICDNHQYTTCQNKEWGYDCVCMVGYKLEHNRCVECTEGRYEMNCKENCSCEVNNTLQCNRQNGSCTCKPGWEGKDCDSDVDECSNKTICDNHQYTTCQNKEWGYDCVCMVGYKLEHNRCVECTEGRYGMNCKEKCSCEVNNTVQCSRQNGSCTCKPGWEGKDCDSDVDECSNITICELQPHTVCENEVWGYDCLCIVGYELEIDSCVVGQSDLPSNNSSTIPPKEAEKIKSTAVVIHLELNLTRNVNLQAASTYKEYKEKAKSMLTNYYKEHLGDSFIQVVIKNLTKGSLVIDHDVETKNIENVTQALTVAVVQMASPKTSPLVFDGKNVSVTGLIMNNVNVSGSDGLCTAFISVAHCQSGCKVNADNMPTCSVLTQSKDNTVLIISVTCGSVVAIAILVVVVVICYRKRRNHRKTKSYESKEDDVQFKRTHDITESEDDSQTKKSIHRPWHLNPFYNSEEENVSQIIYQPKRDTERLQVRSADHRRSEMGSERDESPRYFNPIYDQEYEHANNTAYPSYTGSDRQQMRSAVHRPMSSRYINADYKPEQDHVIRDGSGSKRSSTTLDMSSTPQRFEQPRDQRMASSSFYRPYRGESMTRDKIKQDENVYVYRGNIHGKSFKN